MRQTLCQLLNATDRSNTPTFYQFCRNNVQHPINITMSTGANVHNTSTWCWKVCQWISLTNIPSFPYIISSSYIIISTRLGSTFSFLGGKSKKGRLWELVGKYLYFFHTLFGPLWKKFTVHTFLQELCPHTKQEKVQQCYHSCYNNMVSDQEEYVLHLPLNLLPLLIILLINHTPSW